MVLQVAESLPGAAFAVVVLLMLGFGLGRGLLDLQTRLSQLTEVNAAIGYIVAGISLTGFILGFWFACMFLESLVQYPWSRIGMLLFASALLAINGSFYHLMKAPTLRGRKLLDCVDGFEEYLNAAEEEDLRLCNPPRKTPQLFEPFLPYAMALDVEDLWVKVRRRARGGAA